MLSQLRSLINILGAQRALLAALSVLAIILCFFSDTRLPPYGWNIIFSVVAPAMPPLLFMVYGLDLLMSRVWRAEFGPEQVRRYDIIALFNIGMMLVLALAWLPVFLRN